MSGSLEDLLAEPDSPERTAALVEWIQGLFEEEPVLVGGAAVELYTRGAYSTSDLDFVGSVSPSVAKILEEEGFTRKGRHWVREESQVFIEFPASTLSGGETAVELAFGERRLRVISPEALVLDRLAAWQDWGSEEDAVNALLVCRAVRVELEILEDLPEHRDMSAALARLREALDRWSEEEPGPEELREWASRIPGE